MEEKERTKKPTAGEMHQTFQSLSLSDDFLFGKVMGDQEVCRVTLENILGVPISRIGVPAVEHVIDLLHDKKSIRLDVYVADENGDVYNCEMQTGRARELPRRARYYHGCMDLDVLMKGQKYEALAKSFVIFICTFDPFNEGRYVYTFRNMCDEAPGLAMDDGSHTIFLNTRGTVGDVSAAMKEFLAYVEDSSDEFAAAAGSEWVKQLHCRMKKIKESKELEAEYMKSYLTYLENVEEGIKLGEERGMEEGIKLGEERAAVVWQTVLTERENVISEQSTRLSEKDDIITKKDGLLHEQEARIKELMEKLAAM